MTCAACAAPVQAKLDGVTASVNLAAERAYVTAPPQVGPGELIGDGVNDGPALAAAQLGPCPRSSWCGTACGCAG